MAIRSATHDATGIVQVTLDRPPVNALDIEHLERLAALFGALSQDPSVRGVVITGSGDAFTAGVDTKAYATYSDAERRRLVTAIDAFVTNMLGLRVPCGAAINGHALGGGFVIALAADVRHAAAGRFRLGLTEAAAGVPFPARALDVVKRQLDPTTIRRLVLAGEILPPEEAHQLRLVDAVVAARDVVTTTSERVAALAALPGYPAIKAQFTPARPQLPARIPQPASSSNADTDPAVLRQRVQAVLDSQPFLVRLGCQIADVGVGAACLTLTPGEYDLQQLGHVHGGVLGALVDAASGAAATTVAPPAANVVTIEYKVNFVAPGDTRTPLNAESYVVRRGRTTVCDAQVVQETPHGPTVCARGLVTLAVQSSQEPGGGARNPQESPCG